MGSIRDLSERLLSGAVRTQDVSPMAPMMALEEVAPRAAFVSSFANVTAIDTDEGLVLVDTGSFFMAAATKGIVQSFSKQRLRTALFTHGHVDHVFGVPLYEAEGGPARVVAHEAVPRRFERYRLTRGYNSCINSRQFQMATEFPIDFRHPDQSAKGEHALACHLAEMAALASPYDAGIWTTRAEIYRARAEVETSLMAKGIYASAAREDPKTSR